MMGRGRGRGRDRGWPKSGPKPGHSPGPGQSSGWGVAPPSRHLWVGNLSQSVTESALYEAFLRCGDVERISHVPGRSYAFVDFASEDDAMMALQSLSGSHLAGAPLRIEFSKGDRATTGSSSMDKKSPKKYNFGEKPYERTNKGNRENSNSNPEPSEVLWVGFPSNLNIDEEALARSFSPFGEIVKITCFPGRSYAFVQFRTILSASRAKESLQGKLFNNPRVTISFAKSELALSEAARNSLTEASFQPSTPRFNPDFTGPTREFHMGSPPFEPGFDRSTGFGGDNFDPINRRDSPFYERENYPVSKRIKTFDATGFTERELPDYPFYEFPNNRGYNPVHAFNARTEPWRDRGAVSVNSGEMRGSCVEMSRASYVKEWKWEGVIAKGGTTVCRARCFPVGKALDFMLPEVLNCTARTTLEMLAEHYYQAAYSWAVFFVPDSDSEIISYNDFMNYLREKQRVAVSKLRDGVTLFLVPPSDFSEKVLKVPGKVSISGVILKFPQSVPGASDLSRSPDFQNYLESGSGSFGSGYVPTPVSNVGSYYPTPPLPFESSSTLERSPFRPELSGYVPPPVPPGRPPLPIQPPDQQLSQLTGRTEPVLNPNPIPNLNPNLNPNPNPNPNLRPPMPAGMWGPHAGISAPNFHQSVLTSSGVGLPPVQQQMEGEKQGEEMEPDPQKRLQATLQLAAALLQQIQQQAKPGDPQ